MTNRSIDQVFDQYQKSRLCFAQSIADLALRQQNVEPLTKNGILELLRPLLSDPCSQIRQTSAVALGRLVDHDARLAEELINKSFMPLLLQCVYHGNAAAWGIGYIARHSLTLAQACVEAGAVPLLMLCLQEPELTLKQITTSAISDIAKHSVELAQSVVDSGVIPYLTKSLDNTDEKLKRQILTALSSCAKHSTELAEVVVEAEIFPSVLLLLGHPCPMVRRNAAILIRDIVKHSLELTQMVVNTGGIGALMETLNQNIDQDDGAKVPSITALGFISGHSDQLALSVIGCKAIVLLAQILDESKDEVVLTVTAWCLGQIGKHSPEHSQAVAAANIFPRLLDFYTGESVGEDLKYKCKNALKLCLQKCLLVSALEPLLFQAPANILKYTLGQYSKVIF
ncbi:hypothetical protein NQ318_021665 [Aromia moschata]|uniref:Sperm-associated antigen 6 n=1 Tax=Aromia moschata TaxID=1265417 RepID=A0AAV8YCB2_9CUCU|nr:hypothetical protein NQ318_021665 [Aromia moschata]